jgi:hypothetical protein
MKSYKASAVKINNSANSLVRFKKSLKNLLAFYKVVAELAQVLGRVECRGKPYIEKRYAQHQIRLPFALSNTWTQSQSKCTLLFL